MEDGMITLVDLLPQLKREYEELEVYRGGRAQRRLLAPVQKCLKILPVGWYENVIPRRTHHSLSVFIAAKGTRVHHRKFF